MGAPVGNKNALFNTGGQPPYFETHEEMWNKGVEYFETTKNSSGKYQPTIEGLTFYLGYGTRKSLIDNSERSVEFLNVVNKMKTFIKSCYEKQLYGFAWAGSQFALRNLGKEDWKDEITEHSDKKVTHVVIEEKTRED
jgi:hypothetical protein